jgi:hypothetical protein
MDHAITQWINSLAGSNALFDAVMIIATQAGARSSLPLSSLSGWSKPIPPLLLASVVLRPRP